MSSRRGWAGYLRAVSRKFPERLSFRASPALVKKIRRLMRLKRRGGPGWEEIGPVVRWLVESAVDEQLEFLGVSDQRQPEATGLTRGNQRQPEATGLTIQDKDLQTTENISTSSSSLSPDSTPIPKKNIAIGNGIGVAKVKAASETAVGRLNELLGTKYSSTAKDTLAKIKALLRAGRTVEDLVAVVEDRVKRWGEDEKMAEYLRPVTLFRASNFESYIGQVGIDFGASSGPSHPLERQISEIPDPWENERP